MALALLFPCNFLQTIQGQSPLPGVVPIAGTFPHSQHSTGWASPPTSSSPTLCPRARQPACAAPSAAPSAASDATFASGRLGNLPRWGKLQQFANECIFGAVDNSLLDSSRSL